MAASSLAIASTSAPAEPPLPTHVLLEAIARKLCVTTTYNKMAVKLAPHILYTKHDDLFVDAVTVEREGKAPKEVKLGTFKLAGLSAVGLTRRLFAPQPGFDPAAEKYAGTTLFAVEA